jgi:hypothetical protein
MGKETAAQEGYHHGSHGMEKQEPHGLGDEILTVDPDTQKENSAENAKYDEGFDEGKEDKGESDAKEEADEAKAESEDNDKDDK